ncbi:hypothetical protein AB431_18480 [Mycobacterium sp. EPa45]|nr:hypothetical protein AB431_18480 [Mycobacterium sp. EPa45]
MVGTADENHWLLEQQPNVQLRRATVGSRDQGQVQRSLEQGRQVRRRSRLAQTQPEPHERMGSVELPESSGHIQWPRCDQRSEFDCSGEFFGELTNRLGGQSARSQHFVGVRPEAFTCGSETYALA